jgi:hypothetical protein
MWKAPLLSAELIVRTILIAGDYHNVNYRIWEFGGFNMAKKDEFTIEVSKHAFEKAIADLELIYSEPYLKTDDGFVFTDYWCDDATGLAMAKRVNGYTDVPKDDPRSKPRYLLAEYCAEKAGLQS